MLPPRTQCALVGVPQPPSAVLPRRSVLWQFGAPWPL